MVNLSVNFSFFGRIGLRIYSQRCRGISRDSECHVTFFCDSLVRSFKVRIDYRVFYLFSCVQIKDLGTGVDSGHPSGNVQLPWSKGDLHICYSLEANATLTLRASGTEVRRCAYYIIRFIIMIILIIIKMLMQVN
jgi:hypothetical protein